MVHAAFARCEDLEFAPRAVGELVEGVLRKSYRDLPV